MFFAIVLSVIQGRGNRREPTKLCLELRSVQWFRLFLPLFEYFGERVNHSRCSGLTLAQGYFPFDVFRWNIRRIEHSLDSLLHELPHGFIGVVETTVARATLVSEMHVAWTLFLLGRISRSGLVVEQLGGSGLRWSSVLCHCRQFGVGIGITLREIAEISVNPIFGVCSIIQRIAFEQWVVAIDCFIPRVFVIPNYCRSAGWPLTFCDCSANKTSRFLLTHPMNPFLSLQ